MEYSDQELSSFDLFRVQVVGRAGRGNNTYAAVYRSEPACAQCGRTRYRQVRDLVLDLSIREIDSEEPGYFQHDVCQTQFGNEWVASLRLKTLLETYRVPGISLRAIEIAHVGRSHSRRYFQLVVESQIGPLIEPTRVQRLGRCDACGAYGQVLLDALPGTEGSEFYFHRSSYRGAWLMRTADQFGRTPDFGSELIINQRLYRLWKEHNITGFWVQPAHLVD